jgi:hypothetical protein
MTPAALYRFYGAGRTVLYIGVSLNLIERLQAHDNTKFTWTQVVRIELTWYDSREEALAAEAAAIADEDPPWNHHKPGRRLAPRLCVVDHVTAGIKAGIYPPGSKLPTIGELATLTSTSRTAVKTALLLLNQRGVVQGHQGKGTLVASNPDQTSG